jgi:hypothetical protein
LMSLLSHNQIGNRKKAPPNPWRNLKQ